MPLLLDIYAQKGDSFFAQTLTLQVKNVYFMLYLSTFIKFVLQETVKVHFKQNIYESFEFF